jgi:SAM-dependent methyltransferase
LIDDAGNAFLIRGFIPRFVPERNYCDSFTLEWRLYPDTLAASDAHRVRFARETAWPDRLDGEMILEAGCGPGAFTTAVLARGATVSAFDYGGSVDINYAANGGRENLLLVQANIFAMPFEKGTFDRAFCFGVLQHTPDPRAAFLQLTRMLRAGGAIATDIYPPPPPPPHPYRGLLRSKYLARRFTAGISSEKLHPLVSAYVELVWPAARLLVRTSLGLKFCRRLLIDDPRLTGHSPARYKEFAKLNLFDMLAPAYDIPATVEEFRRWHEQAGLEAIDVGPGYNGVDGRARKPGS